MAQIYAGRLDVEGADRLLSRSLAICDQLDIPRLTAQALCELGELRLRSGHLDEGVKAFEEALRLTGQVGDLTGQAYALTGLGNARRMMHDVTGAESALAMALSLTDRTEDKLIRTSVLLAAAELAFVTGRGDLALARIDDALGLLRQLDSTQLLQARGQEPLPPA